MERKCLTCSEANLFKKRCLDSLHPKESNTILLYHNRSSASFEALRKLPRNKHKMKSKSMKYMYKHSESDCHYGRTCVFPHSKVEEEVWNLQLYFTETLPELKLADRTAVICEVSKMLSCNLLINFSKFWTCNCNCGLGFTHSSKSISVAYIMPLIML